MVRPQVLALVEITICIIEIIYAFQTTLKLKEIFYGKLIAGLIRFIRIILKCVLI